VLGPVASLNTVWFSLIGVLWTGYFLLEGFDFGVGILSPVVARDEMDRRITLNAIGPFWDANEVWVLVAGGATFAAFPQWYATMFSGFYLALFLILVALIVRGVAFEFRSKRSSPRWRRTWGAAHALGSALPALLWGVAFVDLVRGLRIGPQGHYLGGFGGLLAPVAILGGIAGLLLFCLHGAVFLAMKTTEDLRRRALRTAGLLVAPTVAVLAGVGAWVGLDVSGSVRPGALPGEVPAALAALGVLATALVGVSLRVRREGLGFAASALAIAALSGALFSLLFPRVMVSTIPGESLTIWNAASAHETLLVMTVVAAIFTPVVLAYQAWTYWVLRERLRRPPLSAPPPAQGAGPSLGPPAPVSGAVPEGPTSP